MMRCIALRGGEEKIQGEKKCGNRETNKIEGNGTVEEGMWV
jgi:hypothetical protein